MAIGILLMGACVADLTEACEVAVLVQDLALVLSIVAVAAEVASLLSGDEEVDATAAPPMAGVDLPTAAWAVVAMGDMAVAAAMEVDTAVAAMEVTVEEATQGTTAGDIQAVIQGTTAEAIQGTTAGDTQEATQGTTAGDIQEITAEVTQGTMAGGMEVATEEVNTQSVDFSGSGGWDLGQARAAILAGLFPLTAKERTLPVCPRVPFSPCLVAGHSHLKLWFC